LRDICDFSAEVDGFFMVEVFFSELTKVHYSAWMALSFASEVVNAMFCGAG
jgi:hypothetical protein